MDVTVGKLLTVLPSQNGAFAAQQQGQTYGWLPALLLGGAIILFVLTLRTKSWAFGVSGIVVLVVAGSLFFANRGRMYRMDVSPRDALHYEVVENGTTARESNVYLENIASADMEYQRQNSRIVVVMRDGKKLYPLGEDWVNNESQQFQVLNAIRQAIGQIPAPAPTQ